MILLIILIFSEIFTLVVLRHQFYSVSKLAYSIINIIHIILSIWLWILFFRVATYDSFFDNPDFVWLLMALAGMICAVVFPRILLIILHFTGWFLKRGNGISHIRWLTNTGLIIAAIIFSVIAIGNLKGRFNFKNEEVTIKIKGLHQDLDGLKIVQISDLHLSGFYHHTEALRKAINIVNGHQPDIIVNTGDFVTIGWREYGRNDTILSRAKSRYGNFAVMGNHDAGTYNPDFTEADMVNNVSILNNLVESSGYIVLNDAHVKVRIGDAELAIIGVTTAGRHPDIVHGDLDKAITGLDTVDLRLLLTHDPNQWLVDVAGKKKDIEISLSGHTHGMQMGILTKSFRWSPSKYFYPHWNGLYREENQFHYVNRGLGVLAIPFRIWMPPEITVITLKQE